MAERRKASDLIGAGPPPGRETTAAPKPLGVPRDYRAPTPVSIPSDAGRNILTEQPRDVATTFPVRPRYFEGDDRAPAALSPERRAELQRAMANAGVFGSTAKFRLGVWDATSRNAYRSLLEFANASGLTVDQALREWSAGQLVDSDLSPAGGRVRAPLTIRQEAPGDLAKVFDSVAQRQLGRKLQPHELERMTAAFNQRDAGPQRAAYAAAETGGTVTQAPSPATFAEEQVRKANPVEAGAHDIALTAEMWEDLLQSR